MFDFSRNYFELFGLPVGFVVDVDELAQRYRELQKVVHPDRYAAAGAHSQRLSLQGATLINEAYETLKTPLLRARYLLTLAGHSEDLQHRTIDDVEFLAEQMELRESLAAVRNSQDPLADLDRAVAQINRLYQALTAELAVLFDPVTGVQVEQAATTVQKMQFLDRLRAEAEAIEADLDEAC